MPEKKVVSWRDLVSEEMKKRKKEGKSVNLKDVLPELRPMWEKIKKGEHDLYRIANEGEKKLQSTKKKLSKTKKKLSKTSKRLSKKIDKVEDEVEEKVTEEPGHKGSKSITRPGKKNFVTHKGSKFYNRDGHYQVENEEGVVGTPYSTKKTRKKSSMSGGGGCKLCQENKIKIQELEKRVHDLEKKR